MEAFRRLDHALTWSFLVDSHPGILPASRGRIRAKDSWPLGPGRLKSFVRVLSTRLRAWNEASPATWSATHWLVEGIQFQARP